MKRMLFSMVAVLSLGCGKGEGGGGGGGDKAGAEKTVAAGIAAANAAVPADMKERLKFTSAMGEKNRVMSVIPEKWEESKAIPNSYQPGDAAKLGFMTRFSFGTNCDGTCEPKDWVPVVEKVEFKQLKDGFKIEKDEKLGENGRLVVATGDGAVVAVALWSKDAKQYFYCRARLDKEAVAAVPAFEAACRALAPVAW